MTHWDWLLIAGVATMGITVAYLRRPQHKANVMFLPVPFTLATLSVGKPVDATNVLAMPVLFGFAIAVWALHARWLLALIALHTATGEAEYLTKAIAAANSIVRGQQPSGAYSTWGNDVRYGRPRATRDWPGCNALAVTALVRFQKYLQAINTGGTMSIRLEGC